MGEFIFETGQTVLVLFLALLILGQMQLLSYVRSELTAMRSEQTQDPGALKGINVADVLVPVLGGAKETVRSLVSQGPRLMLVVKPGCPACDRALLYLRARAEGDAAGSSRGAIVAVRGSETSGRLLARELPQSTIVVREIPDLGLTHFPPPFVVLLDSRGGYSSWLPADNESELESAYRILETMEQHQAAWPSIDDAQSAAIVSLGQEG